MSAFKGKKKQSTGEQGTFSTRKPLMAGSVTSVTYDKQSKDWMFGEFGTGSAIMIAQRDCIVPDKSGSIHLKADLKKWGAWVAYFSRLGLARPYMARADHYSVPEAWPHLFDAAISQREDEAAGERYVAKVLADRAGERTYNVDAAVRQAGRRRWFNEVRPKMVAQFETRDPRPQPQSFIDKDKLFASYDEYEQEKRARVARKNRKAPEL